MRQAGKSEMEIKQWLDRYLQNSKLPGEQKATMRSNALQSESVVDEGILDFFNPKNQDNVRKGTYHKDPKNKKGTIFSNVSARNEMLRKARGEEAFPTGEVVSEGPEEYAGGQHPSKSPNKKDRDRYETERRRSEAPKGVGVPDKSVGYGQLKQSFEPEGEQIAEGDLGDRARRVVGDQRGGYHGDADYFKKHQDAIDQRLLQMRPYGVKGFPSVKKKTPKPTTQVAHFEPEGEQIDELNAGPSTPVKYDSHMNQLVPNQGAGRPGNVRLKKPLLQKAGYEPEGEQIDEIAPALAAGAALGIGAAGLGLINKLRNQKKDMDAGKKVGGPMGAIQKRNEALKKAAGQ